MQLYEVTFQLNFANTIEIGSACVCAADLSMAKQMAIALLELDITALTKCEAKRIGPNVRLLDRRAVDRPPEMPPPKPIEDFELTYQPSAKGLRAMAEQFKQLREEREARRLLDEQQIWALAHGGYATASIEYECRVLANVIAPDDPSCLRRLGRMLIDRADGKEPDINRVHSIMIDLIPEDNWHRRSANSNQ